MNLIIDIGNTRTKLAWFEHGRHIETRLYQDGDLYDIKTILKEKPVKRAILSCVGSALPEIRTALEEAGILLIVLDHKTPLPLQVSYQTPETLGYDRIAAAAGAIYVCPYCNVLILDMGTAITIDFISSEGVYLGGNISPGLQTRFRSLHEYTKLLPWVSKDADFPSFGTNTTTAIAAGVQQGIIFEINSYMEEYSRLYPACEFIITGGDATFFVSKLKRSIFVIPDLVLKGLNFILEFNTSGKKPEHAK